MTSTSLKSAALALSSLAALTLASPFETNKRQTEVPDGFISEPYYPAPFGGWVESWADSYDRAKLLVDSMTLAEKTNITAGTGIFMGKARGYYSDQWRLTLDRVGLYEIVA